MRKRAFTLSEVLITLTILGVIAAISMSSLIVNQRKKYYVRQFQKSYVTIQDTLKLAQLRNGPITRWDSTLESGPFIERYIIPYLDITKNCGLRKGEGCSSTNVPKNLSNVSMANTYDEDDTLYKVLLSDGSALYMNAYNCAEKDNIDYKCVDVIADTNGKSKPDQFGRDIFKFIMYPFLNDVYPMGVRNFNPLSNTFERYYNVECQPWNSSATNDNGLACGAEIVSKGNKMDY